MRFLASALTFALLVAGCSAASGGNRDRTIEAACADLPGSTWRSLELLVGPEVPGGGHGWEHWGIEFSDTEATWRHTDVQLTVSYTCNEGRLSAGESWREYEPQFVVDDDALLLEWHGDLYEPVRLARP